MAKKIQFSFDTNDLALLAAMKEGGGFSTLSGTVKELIRVGHIIAQHLRQGFELQLVKEGKIVLLTTPLFYFCQARAREKKGD